MQAAWAPSLTQQAVWGLAERWPALSAHRRLTAMQTTLGLAALMAAAALVLTDPGLARLLFGVCFSCLFLCVIAVRLLSLLPPPDQALGTSRPSLEDDPPVYSVLVPLFRETPVLRQLLRALSRLDYPQDKLDIKLIIEESDLAMRRATAILPLPDHVEIIIVPCAEPQTKPKALNYALQFARGAFLTVFDAEDMPKPRQLKRALAAFAAAPPDTACLQARLRFYNPADNWLTRQFTIEYAALFELLLPALAAYGLPLPLGGTSNHFRTDILRQVGAWDPFNVTEDADLGLRFARAGFRVGVFASVTYEEANCRLGNWVRQRARWLKGWARTWLVHMREPKALWRDLGPMGFLVAQALMLGMFASSLLHPFFLILTIASFASGEALPARASLLMTLVTGANLAVLVSGYAVAIWVGVRGLRVAGIRGWSLALAAMPLYWFLISVAAWRALWELIWSPFSWNKTEHGLSHVQQDADPVCPPALTVFRPPR